MASAWDRRMVHEGKIAGLPDQGGRSRGRRGQDDREREREERREDARTSKRGEQLFREERLPELRWGKAKDALEYGSDRMGALRAMTDLVKTNLDHKKARDWLNEVALLAAGGSQTAAVPAPGVPVKPDPVELELPEPPTLPDPPTLPES